jgi:heptosyltransferase-2
MARPSFLLVRIAALGDIVLATPLLNRIRAEHPAASITWVCGNRVRELVALFPGIEEIISIDEVALFRGGFTERAREVAGLWRRLVGRRFDRVFLLHPDSRYRLLTWPLRGSLVVAAKHPPSDRANPIPGRFRGDESARLWDGSESRGPIVGHYPLVDLRDRLAMPPAQTSKHTRIVLVPGGARNVLRQDALRRWPVESYRELAEELIATDAEVVLIGDSADAEFGRQFANMAVVNLIGSTALPETLRVLRDANVVVTHDTGPLHLARAVRTPTIALFGPTDPAQFVGSDPLVTVLWGGDDLACRPCYDGKNFAACSNNICINRISVRTVLGAVRDRLARQSLVRT